MDVAIAIEHVRTRNPSVIITASGPRLYTAGGVLLDIPCRNITDAAIAEIRSTRSAHLCSSSRMTTKSNTSINMQNAMDWFADRLGGSPLSTTHFPPRPHVVLNTFCVAEDTGRPVGFLHSAEWPGGS